MCMDYHGLNKVTKILALISGLLEQFGSAKIFTKIDWRGAYNLVRVKKKIEWETIFCIRYGHFEYSIMPFRLTNALAVFNT